MHKAKESKQKLHILKSVTIELPTVATKLTVKIMK